MSDKLNMDEIKARIAAATAGPWNWDSENYIHDPNPVYVASIRQSKDAYPLICDVRYPFQEQNTANIKFIARRTLKKMDGGE
jgi:hypothetical protein